LQDVISLMRQSELGLPLQFVNMKSWLVASPQTIVPGRLIFVNIFAI
jgi:hypothetical protein